MEGSEGVLGANDVVPSASTEQVEPVAASPSPLPQRKKELRLCLDRREVDMVASASTEDSVAPEFAFTGRV